MMDFASRGTTHAWGGRAFRHAGALILCALALLVGVAAVDDYDATNDTIYYQRPLADVTLRYLDGDSNAFETIHTYHDRFYGAAFEVPLLLAERVFGSNDSRSAFLARHLLSHLFFLAAAGAGYLLACRLFRSRAVALFALALFLLHPRIYAHSFFNSKDVPFLGMFMICLWLACRAFMGRGSRERWGKKGSPGAFALCGVAAGLLVNLRVMGLVFLAVVAAARLCDLWRGGDRTSSKRWRILVDAGIFLASAALAYYASMPYLWADPFGGFTELLEALSNHPTRPVSAFQGELVNAEALPPHYVPVWFGITTPPLALLLGAVGVASLVRRGMARPGALLRNTPLRFELLLAACIALPLLTVVVLRPVMYGDWRHTYFLWAPFALLAASGLRALVDATRHLPRHLPLTPRLARLAVHGLAALGLAAVAVQMVRLHPHQSAYFNALATAIRADAILANRTSSEPLHKRYRLIKSSEVVKTGYAYILEEYPDAVVNMQTHMKHLPPALPGAAAHRHLETFARRERRRIAFDPNADPDFHILSHRSSPPSTALDAPDAFFPPTLYELRLYGSAVLRVATPDLSRVDAATAAAYRALHREATAGAPAIDGYFDVYRSESAITLTREACAPADLHELPKLTVYPAAAHPSSTAGFRAYMQSFHGVRIGRSCLWQTPLPDSAVAQIRIHGHGRLEPDAHLDDLRRHLKVLTAGSPAARSTFNVYWHDRILTYVKAPCTAADVEAPFFLHVVPAHPNTGAAGHQRSQHGFENLDFRWHRISGNVFDDACLAERDLPSYPIAHIATGQFTLDGGGLWRVDIPVRR